MIEPSSSGTRMGQTVSMTTSPMISSGPSMEVVPLANKPLVEKKSLVYAEVVRSLNSARKQALPFKVRSLNFYFWQAFS